MRNAADEYLYNQVMTATPARLHLMVVDASLRFARQSIEAMKAGDSAQAFAALNRSRACVNEMALSVNDEPNPELAKNFKSLLAYVYKHLALADFQQNVVLIEESIRILEIHRDTWIELLDRQSREQSSSSIPVPPKAPSRPIAPAYGDSGDSQLSLVG